MAASQAISGYGTKIEVSSDAGVSWTELGEVTDITPPDDQADETDVTHLKSPNRTKEFKQGLTDPGTMTVSMNVIPGSDTDDYIVAWKAAGDNRSTRITYPNAATETFPSFPKGYKKNGIQPSGKMSADLTLRVAGSVTHG